MLVRAGLLLRSLRLFDALSAVRVLRIVVRVLSPSPGCGARRPRGDAGGVDEGARSRRKVVDGIDRFIAIEMVQLN